MPDIEKMPKSVSPSPPPSPPVPDVGVRGVTPLNWATDVEEEVTDTHLSIVCKFMSDDQVCYHRYDLCELSSPAGLYSRYLDTQSHVTDVYTA